MSASSERFKRACQLLEQGQFKGAERLYRDEYLKIGKEVRRLQTIITLEESLTKVLFPLITAAEVGRTSISIEEAQKAFEKAESIMNEMRQIFRNTSL